MDKHFDSSEEEKTIDFRLLFYRILRQWYIVVACVLLSGVISWYYLKKATQVFEGSTTVLVQDKQNKFMDAQKLIGLDIGQSSTTVENEQQIILSKQLSIEAVKRIDWQVSYFIKGRKKTTNLYEYRPF